MFRTLLSTIALLVFAASAHAQPALGKPFQVEFTDKLQKLDPTNSRTPIWTLQADYPIEQGDRFRIEMEPVGGVELKLRVVLLRDGGKGMFVEHEVSNKGSKIDWTNAKGLPGKHVRIYLQSHDLGKVNVRITKVGVNDSTDEKDAEIKKLKDENAALKKDLADLKQQLAEIKKLLEKKN